MSVVSVVSKVPICIEGQGADISLFLFTVGEHFNRFDSAIQTDACIHGRGLPFFSSFRSRRH